MAMGGIPDGGGDDELGGVFSEINITPLTDIFLVLLIIFMVGASMAVDAASSPAQGQGSGVEVDLPRGSSKDIVNTAQDVVVAILADGRVVLDGEEVKEGDLPSRFGSAFGKSPDATVIIQADEGVAHGRVVQVMEGARTAGFQKLAVATRGGDAP